MLKTTNGGESWVDITATGMHSIMDTKFLSVNNGYAVGESSIYHTTDGGDSWVTEKQIAHITYTMTALTSTSIFAVGNDGTIMIKPDSVVTRNPESLMQNSLLSLSCFPNPFNDQLSIQYTLPKKSWVIIDLFSNSGTLVKTFVIGYQKAGKQIVKFEDDHLLPGLYLFRIKAGNLTETRKVIKL